MPDNATLTQWAQANKDATLEVLAATPAQPLEANRTYFLDTTGGTFQVQLPQAELVSGDIQLVGVAGDDPVLVLPSPGDTINGEASAEAGGIDCPYVRAVSATDDLWTYTCVVESPGQFLNYLSQSKEAPETTTSSVRQVYDQLVIPADTLFPAGLYRVGVKATQVATSSNTECEMDGTVNGAVFVESLVEPRAGLSFVPASGATTFPGSINVGSPTVIQVRYSREQGSGTAGLIRSFIEVERKA